MIHMKSLIRRLDCVPWLLAACALVWAGEATAQIILSLDKYIINERAGGGTDGKSVDLVVTAKAAGNATGSDAFVELDVTWTDDGAGEANENRLSVDGLGRVKIPKDKDSGTLTLKIFPRDNTDDEADIDITVSGVHVLGGGYADATAAVTSTAFRLVDNDGASTRIRLSVDTQDLKDEGDAMDIKVTATLDGLKITSAGATEADNVDREVKFQLAAVEITSTEGVYDNFVAGQYGNLFDDGNANTLGADSYAQRDEHYDIVSFKEITIAKDKVSGEVTLNIDPRSFATDVEGPLYIMIGARDGGTTSSLSEAGPIVTAGGTATDLTVVPALIRISKGEVAQLVDDGIKAIPSGRNSNMIPESAGETTIRLEVSLKAEAGDDGQPVKIEINDLSGKRDEDYQVRLGPSLTIEKGSKTGIVEVIVTPKNDDNKDDIQFEVIASVSGSRNTEKETITIVDDDKDTKNISLTGIVMVEGRDNLELYEEDGPVTIEVTATVDGKPLTTDAAISLTLAPSGDDLPGPGSATRDVDYELESRTFVLPKETSSHSMEITITPKDDGKEEKDNETIILGDQNAKAGKADDPTADLDPAVAVGFLTIVLKDGADPDAPAEEDAEEDAEPEPALALVDEETDVAGTVGEELSKDLPEVSGTSVDEDSEVEYLLSGTLPAGLSFDAEARTISGTPTAVGEAEVEYIALVNGTNIRKTYTITISEKPAPEINLEGIASTHTSVRENGGEASITLTVTLEDAAGAGGEDVTLTIVTPTEGKAAHRDVDFDATLQGSITIAEGETSGTATLTVTPKDNTTADGHKAFGVEATSSSGHAAIVNIGISDNESASEGIALSVDPDEVSEGTSTDVTVTASLDGKASEDDVTVSISIGASSSATRDVDYSAVFDGGAEVTIAAGDISGTATVTITAGVDDDGDETIVLVGSAEGLGMGSAAITLVEGVADTGEGDDGEGDDGEGDDGEGDAEPEMPFAFAGEVADQAYTAGTEITPLVVPEATGGEGEVTYKAFDLPAGLTFDAATRTISGTPEAAGTAEVTVLAQDEADAATTLTISITVNPALSFGDLFGAGKIIPTDGLTEIREFVIGQRVEGLTLPEGAGGTAPLTYSLSPALPAGLTFDAVTRTIAGTPREASETVYTYTVTDANGASLSMSLQTLPAAFSLADNFPNPFNPATTIQYALPQAADVELTVYNVLGQPIRTLVAEHQNAGRYVVEWDATNDSGHSLSSGMYLYRLQAGGEFHEVKKMLLLK